METVLIITYPGSSLWSICRCKLVYTLRNRSPHAWRAEACLAPELRPGLWWSALTTDYCSLHQLSKLGSNQLWAGHLSSWCTPLLQNYMLLGKVISAHLLDYEWFRGSPGVSALNLSWSYYPRTPCWTESAKFETESHTKSSIPALPWDETIFSREEFSTGTKNNGRVHVILKWAILLTSNLQTVLEIQRRINHDKKVSNLPNGMLRFRFHFGKNSLLQDWVIHSVPETISSLGIHD